jgi:hypothetical protein
MVDHTSIELQSPLTQAERRDLIKQDRKAREQQQRPATFKAFADAFANEARDGRYAKSDHGATIKPLPSGP